ncbi:sugar transferase [Metabacillus halosaccharovorans]|uniref:sugar transferase n=1 Tax=Metabacillus halosaccharovorans TaxID=930124 RepID=UPI001C1FD992|nr:sugar transferase [Metabacillus halosaccharovorans]MBU7594549.1 sugar transferase [Metabacillus halosaccharovorans]
MSELMIRRKNKFLFLGLDMLCILLSYVFAFLLRFDEIPERNIDSFFALIPWILLISLLFLSVYELYNIQRRNKWDMLRDILVANTFIVFITMAFSFIFREFALPRTIIVISYFIAVILMITWKMIYIKYNKVRNIENVVLFGHHQDMKKLINDLKSSFSNKITITCIDPEVKRGNLDVLIKSADMIAISPNISEKAKTKIVSEAISKNKTVFIVPSTYELFLTKSTITSVEDTMVLSVKPFGLSLDQLLLKRLSDLIISIFSLILFSPFFLLAIVLIKFEDPKGSVFFGQKRLGRYNKEFTILKFRSMIENAEKETGPVLASENDQRITKIGKFLRMTRIDEMPQLINVLRGDMSIVGPRPEREHFIKEFEQKHESYKYRNTVKPGMTGVAQVMGKYTTSVEDKLRYDLFYIRNYSIWLDILLLLRTVIVVLDKTKSEGASEAKKVRSKFRET